MALGTCMDTEIGRLYLAEEDGRIVRLTLGPAPAGDCMGVSPLLTRAAAQVREYLAGERKTFTVPLKAEGTPFQKTVWEALRRIPYGRTRSYGEIAEEIGNPKGARAVGMACNRNPILLLIPCHRVIGSTGKLVGFGCGLPVKEKLLSLEKRVEREACMEQEPTEH